MKLETLILFISINAFGQNNPIPYTTAHDYKTISCAVNQDYVIQQDFDLTVEANASTQKLLVHMPPVGLCDGKTYVIRKVDRSKNPVVLLGFDGEKILNYHGFALVSYGQELTLTSKGGVWTRVARKEAASR